MDEPRGLPKVAALASKLVDLVMDQVAIDRCVNRENIMNAMMGPLVTFELEAERAIARAAKSAEAPNVALAGLKHTLVHNLHREEMAREPSLENRPGSLSKFAVDEAGGIWTRCGAYFGREVWSGEIPESAVLPNTDTPIWKRTPCGIMRQLFWTDARMLERRAYAEATGHSQLLFDHLDLSITPEGEVITGLEAMQRGCK